MAIPRSARGRRLIAVVVVLLAGIAVTGTGTTFAAFSGQTGNAGNVVSAKPDWTPPTVSASQIVLASGKAPGTIRPGGTYYVYGSASDDGSPPSGVQSVVANVSNLTTGASGVAMVAGSYTVGATTYGWRSALQTANAGLGNGAYTYSHQVTDFDANSRDQTGFPVSVDAVAPTGVDVQAVNGGTTANAPDAGDVITFSFSEAIDPDTVIAAWDGSATAITMRFTRSGGATSMTARSGAADLPLGPVALGSNFGLGNGASQDFPATMVMSGTTLTVTLGVPSAALGTGNGTTPLGWALPATVKDVVGNTATAATITETGAVDRDF